MGNEGKGDRNSHWELNVGQEGKARAGGKRQYRKAGKGQGLAARCSGMAKCLCAGSARARGRQAGMGKGHRQARHGEGPGEPGKASGMKYTEGYRCTQAGSLSAVCALGSQPAARAGKVQIYQATN